MNEDKLEIDEETNYAQTLYRLEKRRKKAKLVANLVV